MQRARTIALAGLLIALNVLFAVLLWRSTPAGANDKGPRPAAAAAGARRPGAAVANEAKVEHEDAEGYDEEADAGRRPGSPHARRDGPSPGEGDGAGGKDGNEETARTGREGAADGFEPEDSVAVFAAPTGAFHYTEDERPASLLPFFAEDAAAVRVVEFLFDGLVVLDKTGEARPALATSWTVDPDRRGVTFTLRPQVKWHDGQPFTADDVAFTFQAAKDPATRFLAQGRYDFVRKVTVVDPGRVHVALRRDVGDPVARFARLKIIPKHAFRGTAISRKDPFARSPIGTGPYRLKMGGFSLRSIALEANPAYWKPVGFAEVQMQHTPDKSAQINLLQYSGAKPGVFAVIWLPPKNIPLFEKSDTITITLEPFHTSTWWYLAFNHDHPALADRAVRQAFALAIDRQELLEAHLGKGELLSGPHGEASPYIDPRVEPTPVDTDRAVAVLDAAGWKLSPGLPVRRKGSEILDFEFVLDKELPANQALFLGMRAMLAKVGINVRATYLDHARYRDTVFNRHAFDLTLNHWSFDELEDVTPLFHSRGEWNYIGYHDAEVDALLDAATATKDQAVYRAKMKALHPILARERPYLFLWTLDIYSAVSKDLENVYLAPYAYFTTFPEWRRRPAR